MLVIISIMLASPFIFLLYWQVRNFKRRQHIRALRYRPFVGQYDSPIFKLPNEILQLIAKTLPPGNAAAFAMSCRPILFSIGEGCLMVKGEDRLELFRCLEAEFPRHILCHDCIAFHPRTPLHQSFPNRPCSDGDYGERELYATSPCLEQRGFLFKDGQQIMNRYRYGIKHGPSADQAGRITVIETTLTGTRASQADELRIVGGVLLLRTHTTLSFRNDNVSAKEWALNYSLRTCSHYPYAETRKRFPYKEVFRKCSTCSTEIRYKLITLNSTWDEYQITRWFDLGCCRDPSDYQWVALTDCDWHHSGSLPYIRPKQAVLKAAFEGNVPRQAPPVDDLLRRVDRIERMIGYQEALWSSIPN